MTGDGTARRWRLVAGVGVATAAAFSSTWMTGASATATGGVEALGWAALVPLFGTLGALIVLRQKGNRIGWVLLAIGAGLALDAVGGLASAIDVPAAITPGVFLLLWVNNWSWVGWLFPFFLLLYLFPTGSLLSSRWRWAPRLLMVMALFMMTVSAVPTRIAPFDESWELDNPIGFIPKGVIDAILTPWLAGLLAAAMGGVVCMVMRYRRASLEERAQIKWVLLAVGSFGCVYVFSLSIGAWYDGSLLTLALLTLSVAAVPVSITVAILKYRLYDIDVVISRSLTYGALAIFIGAVYVGIVVGVGNVFGRGDGGGFGLSVGATAVVALAFQPVRRAVERWANRLVYGERATPYEVLARFSRRAAEASDEEFLARVPRLIVEGTGAVRATLWVRSEAGFSATASWPEDAGARTVGPGDGFADPDADYSLSVFHQGELLGGISLVKARGEAVDPTEEELLGKLADGMGLALRNTRLTAQLRRQVEDLERSRDRVVEVADEARRSLEHDLDSGPQQQLVAVKVKLGPIRRMAEAAGATRTAEVLAGIESQAGDAIRAVRDFAAGIYPPLLEAEGLAVAIHQEARRAALPIAVDGDGTGRYPRDVEAAVYFTVLEALQNTAKYSGATSARVTLRDGGGAVTFEVRDDGRGFDPSEVRAGAGLAGMADRMDAVDGWVAVESAPGAGTVVTGSVPVPDQAREASRHTSSSVSMPNSDLGTKQTAPAAVATEA